MLGRFAQADTVVPGGVQGYDRYAYANNNPILYNDPSGHCVNGDIECRDELRETAKKYSVSINDTGGLWTLKGLGAIAHGMGKFQKALGKDSFKELFGGVAFSVGGCKYTNQLCTTGHRDIRVGVDAMNDADYVSKESIHEFAHIWDKSCSECMGKGIMDATGSYYENGKYVVQGVPATDYILPGQNGNNAGDDWAESVVGALEPGYAKPEWDLDRRLFVDEQFAAARMGPRYGETHMQRTSSYDLWILDVLRPMR